VVTGSDATGGRRLGRPGVLVEVGPQRFRARLLPVSIVRQDILLFSLLPVEHRHPIRFRVAFFARSIEGRGVAYYVRYVPFRDEVAGDGKPSHSLYLWPGNPTGIILTQGALVSATYSNICGTDVTPYVAPVLLSFLAHIYGV
jgi:hypothetical protein